MKRRLLYFGLPLLLLSLPLAARQEGFHLKGQSLSELCRQLSEQAGVSLVLPSELEQQGKPLDLRLSADLAAALAVLELHFPVRFVQLPSGVLVQPKALPKASTTAVVAKVTLPVTAPAPEQIQIRGQRWQAFSGRQAGGWLDSQQKRQSLQWQDRWQLSGPGQLNDLNLADSLQGLPGVSLTRDNGEGKQMALWGLNADFVRVELDGMDALAVSGTSMDSRGQGSRTRGFDFNVFASELFSEVVLKKSYQASDDEGGIAGTVLLKPAKALDYQDDQFRLSGQLGGNSRTAGSSPRLAALWSKRNEQAGLLFSVAYSEKDGEESGYNTYKFRPLDAAGVDVSALDTALQQQIAAKQLKFARGNRLSVWHNDQQRLGLTSSVQYQSKSGALWQLDALLARLRQQKQEYHLASRGTASSLFSPAQLAGGQMQNASRLLAVQADQDGYVNYAHVADAVLTSESRLHQLDSDFYQWQLQLQQPLSQRSSLQLQLGHSANQFRVPVNDKVYYEAFAEVITYYRDRFNPQNTYLAALTDSALWSLHEVDLDESSQSSDYDKIRLELSTEFDSNQQLNYGVTWKKFSNSGASYGKTDLLKTQLEQGQLDDSLQQGTYRQFNDYGSSHWLVADVRQTLASYQLDSRLTEADVLNSSSFNLAEETSAAWLDYQWRQDEFKAGVGLRLAQNRWSSGALQLQSVSFSDSRWLPTAQIAWTLADDWVWRSSVSGNLSRPSLGALSATATVNTERQDISAGNPALKPYYAISAETALEWYFADKGYLSAAVFQKKLDNYVETQSRLMPFSQTGLSPQLLAAGQTPDSLFWYRAPVNSRAAKIRGLELATQSPLSFLAAPLDQLSLALNYTYSAGVLDYQDGANRLSRKNLLGLSRHTANLALLYEAPGWGWRLTGAYRSRYLNSVTPQSEDEDESGFLSGYSFDASAYYQYSEQLDFTFEINNITSEKDIQYTDSSQHLYNMTRYGSSYYLGFSLRL